MPSQRRLAVIGAGWSGLSAAVNLVAAACNVTVFEASQHLGGRARSLAVQLPDGSTVDLDNGQHILIGAYTQTLALMARLGIDRSQVFQETPLRLLRPNGQGLRLPRWPQPWDALAGIARARGWSWRDKRSLLAHVLRWRLQNFQCPAAQTVADLCAHLSPAVMAMLIEPLCVSALNTPVDRASAQVFLRVLQDSVLGPRGSSYLLLPQTDLGALLPVPASRWLHDHGAQLQLGQRVTQLEPAGDGWLVNGQDFDGVVLATSLSHAITLLQANLPNLDASQQAALASWLKGAQSLEHEAIATVYAYAPQASLQEPMLALHSDGHEQPAQFVFDRGQLGGPAGVLAFVVSASHGSRAQLENQVLAQAHDQLGLRLSALATVVEKRATFACTPGLKRPWADLLPGLVACGDYLQSPYPATLETAVRSGQAAAQLLLAGHGH